MPTSPFLRARTAYRRLAFALARRAAGREALPAGVPDWIDPAAVVSLSLALSGREARPIALEVALRDGIPGSALPRSLALPGTGGAIPLRTTRALHAIAQGAPGMLRQESPRIAGTATCLVRDRLAPQRNYVLTCGHVAAPDAGARVNQALDIDDAGQVREGRLVDWQPSMGVDVYRTTIDAALVEVAAGDAIALRAAAGFVPAGLGGDPTADMPVTLRRGLAPLDGHLRVYWSGYVDLPGLTPGFPDYFLADAIGYHAAEPTQGGDSGSAIWDASERLMGMHIGGLPDTGSANANAVYGPIAPVLAWYSVQPYLHGDPATLPAAAPRGAPDASARLATPALGPAGADPGQEVAIVASTLWGEARNQGEEGMRAVACVVNNRLLTKYRGKTTAATVCLDPKQFSCWNAGDPNLPRVQRIATAPDDAYRSACAIARELQQGRLADITNGARHYYAVTLRPPAYWSRGKSPCKVIGDHLFFNDVD